MEQQFLQGVSKQERLQALKDSAERTELMNYPKALSEVDLDYLKNELVNDSVKLAKLEEARKEFLTGHKAKVKPLKQNVGLSLVRIRSKVEEVEEEVFLLADQEEGMMGYYNADGNLVYQRVLLPDERQIRIVTSKSGTNN